MSISSEERVAISEEFLWQTKWWAFGGRFPLVPIYRHRPGNKWNTPNFSLSWLGFRIWTMDSPDIGFEINLDDQNLCVRLRLPYLITGFWLPLFPASFSQKTWRKARRDSKGDGHE